MELILKDDNQNTLTVSDAIFSRDFNEALIHQVIVAYAAGSRQGTRAQKTRAEVAGSTRKPWRQKGTGRARSGSIRSPIWRSGGVTFSARPQNHSQKINKKMYRGALKSILSELIRQNRLILVKDFFLEAPKTSLLLQKLKKIALGRDTLIINNKLHENLCFAARNLHKVEVRDANSIDPIILITFKKILITTEAIKKIEGMLA